MINISELEKRWFKYKIKFYAPYFILTVALTVALIISLYIFSSKAPLKSKIDIQHKTIKKVKIIKEQNITNTQEINNKKSSLLPSLDFLENLTIENKEETLNVNIIKAQVDKYLGTKYIAVNKPIKKEIPILIENKPSKKETPIVKIEPIKEINIQIKRRNISSDIDNVIKRFKKNNNPALSLFIAKKYYEIANYNEAYNYSLITNQLNDSIEDSWIIFAKSLVKLNKKGKAIKILNKYFKYSNSNKAKILLDNILSGKFQ